MTRRPKPVNLNVRLPIDLYQAIDAYADHADVSLSEALRQLAVQALDAQGMRHQTSTGDGLIEDTAWRQPLAPQDQD